MKDKKEFLSAVSNEPIPTETKSGAIVIGNNPVYATINYSDGRRKTVRIKDA